MNYFQKKTWALQLLKALRSKFDVGLLVGDCTNVHRHKTLEKFLSKDLRILITTNLMSRCIDNRNVCLVINFDLPMIDGLFDTKVYDYRAGRTARYNDGGTVLSFVTPENRDGFETALRRDLGIKVESI